MMTTHGDSCDGTTSDSAAVLSNNNQNLSRRSLLATSILTSAWCTGMTASGAIGFFNTNNSNNNNNNNSNNDAENGKQVITSKNKKAGGLANKLRNIGNIMVRIVIVCKMCASVI
jgi:hypothetical protein